MYNSLSGLGQKTTNQTNVDKPKSSHRYFMNYNKEKTKQGHCLLWWLPDPIQHPQGTLSTTIWNKHPVLTLCATATLANSG